MADMTDEEYDALDELLTRTVPKLGPNGTGFFSSKGFQMIAVDEPTARILNAKAMATRQTPSELVATMVRRELVASV
ncbi:MAG: hypothetical protein LBS86_06335 [Treponema sp.]|jgi:hypothetical protein|nr:hypothetical protein [Treponema sp.]